MKKLGMKKYFIPVILLVAIIYNVVVFWPPVNTPRLLVTLRFLHVGICLVLLTGLIARKENRNCLYSSDVTISGLFGRLPCFFSDLHVVSKIANRALLIPMVIITGILRLFMSLL